MYPDHICEKVAMMGADVSRRTLLNYEAWGLIPIPIRGGGGKEGRFTDYPDGTIEEVYAAWSLMHGKYGNGSGWLFEDKNPKISADAIRVFRNAYYNGDTIATTVSYNDFDPYERAAKLITLGYTFVWQSECAKAKEILRNLGF